MEVEDVITGFIVVVMVGAILLALTARCMLEVLGNIQVPDHQNPTLDLELGRQQPQANYQHGNRISAAPAPAAAETVQAQQQMHPSPGAVPPPSSNIINQQAAQTVSISSAVSERKLGFVLICRSEEEIKSKLKESACPICLDLFMVGDECRILPKCRHGYHKACIDKWLAKDVHCPLCRGSTGARVHV